MTKANGADADNFPLFKQIIPSGGMQILDYSVAADKSRAVFNADGCDKVYGTYGVESTVILNGESGKYKGITCGVYNWSVQSKWQGIDGAIYYSHSQLAFTTDDSATGGSDENDTAFVRKHIDILLKRHTVPGNKSRHQDTDIGFQLDKSGSRYVMTHAGRTRTGMITIPVSHNGSKPFSLVFGLHGQAGTGKHFKSITGFDRLAGELDFIVMYPDGYNGDWVILPSADRSEWTTVYSTETGTGNTEFITFSPVKARYIRMFGKKRATIYGCTERKQCEYLLLRGCPKSRRLLDSPKSDRYQ